MSYRIGHINEIIRGQFLQADSHDYVIEHLILDSRQLVFASKSLFFALSGQRNDGHQFIAECYEKGVRNFVVSQTINLPKFPAANFLRVANCLDALQQLATYHRQSFKLECIGITGSNGKTIVKEWLFQLLQADYSIVRSPKSYNSQIGVPLSVWQIDESHEMALLEAGISQKGEMVRLAPIIQCELGIFTNIGPAHAQGFSSVEEKIQEKLHLFAHAHTLIYCADHENIHQAIQALPKKQLFHWSTKKGKAQVWISDIETIGQQTHIRAVYQAEELAISIPFSDQASIENAIHCWVFMLYKNYPPALIRQRMKQLETVAMRLELKAGIRNCTIVNDSYNSDLNSLAIALHFLKQQSKQAKKSLILSDILQSKEDLPTLYTKVAQLIRNQQIERFIGIGKDIAIIREYLPKEMDLSFFTDTDTFLSQLETLNFSNETILLKGARQFAFERITNRLAQKAHRTVLEINLNALRHNLNVYSSYLQKDTQLMVMVKASAYGSGSAEVARLLENQHVDFLAVAYADEGIALRKAGIGLPIMVLNPEEVAFDAMIRYQLEPEIYSLRLLQAYINYLSPDQPSAIHLKIETGMHRLGFEEAQLSELITLLGQHPQVKVRSVFSHLVASEAVEHDDFSQLQAQRFEQFYEALAAEIGYRPIRHLLNSSGIIRFPQYQMDMVRLGIGLYGIDSSDLISNRLQMVHSFKTSISQIKEVAARESIGYGRQGQSGQGMRIGTIQVGYADGLRRAAGNGRFFFEVHGKRAATVGNICMDMCMIDLSDIPEAREGDEIIIFNTVAALRKLAQCYDSIAYEVFTGISERVKRVYYQE